jgi:hypothetical protein
VPPTQSAADAQLSVLVPWAKITDKKIDGSIARLELEFDCSKMPAEFQLPVLATILSKPLSNRELIASGYR